MCCGLGPQWAWHPWGAVRESASQSVSHSDSGPGEAGPAAGPKPLQSQTWNLKNVLWSGLVTQQKGPARPTRGRPAPPGVQPWGSSAQNQSLWECVSSGQVGKWANGWCRGPRPGQAWNTDRAGCLGAPGSAVP